MRINVYTRPRLGHDLDSQRKDIDWNNASDRKWLHNHTHWAMHNNRSVTLTPMESN